MFHLNSNAACVNSGTGEPAPTVSQVFFLEEGECRESGTSIGGRRGENSRAICGCCTGHCMCCRSIPSVPDISVRLGCASHLSFFPSLFLSFCLVAPLFLRRFAGDLCQNADRARGAARACVDCGQRAYMDASLAWRSAQRRCRWRFASMQRHASARQSICPVPPPLEDLAEDFLALACLALRQQPPTRLG